MLAQLIIGPAEEEKKSDQALQAMLEDSGFQVNLITVDEAIQHRQRDHLARQLSDQAALTVANSGIRWANVAHLVDPVLLPNAIVITSSMAMHYGWEYKPAIILDRGANLAANLHQASRSIYNGTAHLPVRTGSYKETSYGLRLQESGGDTPVDIWQSFTAYVHPGFRFSTRLHPDGRSTQFTITKILNEMVVFKVDISEQVVAVTKEELLEHYETWLKDKRGEGLNGILINEYVIGILDWMDDSHFLA